MTPTTGLTGITDAFAWSEGIGMKGIVLKKKPNDGVKDFNNWVKYQKFAFKP